MSGYLAPFVALFVAGLFLALVRERTGYIGWCTGGTRAGCS